MRFRSASAPVLVGSSSFWQGIDVLGAQLSLVIIDKLPFAAPDEPVDEFMCDGIGGIFEILDRPGREGLHDELAHARVRNRTRRWRRRRARSCR